MGHVADEARLARIATHHFGPLVPPGRPTSGKEKCEQRIDRLAPAEPDEAADGAGLVRRIIIPLLGAIGARLKLAPVTLERRAQHRGVEPRLLIARIERDGGRSRVEIAQAGRAGDEGDVPMIARGEDRGVKVGGKFIARRRQFPRFRLAQCGGNVGRVAIPAQRPEIVPQAILRLGRIAFVADRRRHQAVEHPLVGREIGRNALAPAQLVHIARGGEHRRPVPLERGAIVGEAEQLADQEDIFALAVIFGHRVGAAKIDAARHLSASEQMPAIKIRKVARDVGPAHPQQGLGHHRPVADPRPIVAARSGLEHRSVAAGEDVREGRGERVGEAPLGGRDGDGDPAKSFPPMGDGL